MLQSIARTSNGNGASKSESPASATLTVVQIENYAAGMKAATADSSSKRAGFELLAVASSKGDPALCGTMMRSRQERFRIFGMVTLWLVVSFRRLGFRTLSERADLLRGRGLA